MPHTSSKHRKKFTHPKRIEITDEDGWTHVSNTHSVPSPSSGRKKMIMTDGAVDDDDHPAQTILNDDTGSRGGEATAYKLSPSEPPPRLTLPELRKQFTAHQGTWESSQTWQQLKHSLSKDILDQTNTQLRINNIVCIGLGSPSGFVQGGWVDRRSVALYQLASLVSIATSLKQHQKNHKTPKNEEQEEDDDEKEIEIIAQDPVFNTLDVELLSSLGIEVVNTPEGFNAVNERTFLFAPGAERRHLRLMLPSNPAMVFGGPLEEGPSLTSQRFDEDDNSTIENDDLADYVARTRSVKLQEFEARPETFWRMRVYWLYDE
ncbi:conserved hypothetical protein [Talaromyces stipitatus ATCC 10500]|uniref:SRR1-like domain-containing protein n=1 Tax=Talaromyces stipitatus (strain ATCC 10500 / CBS 375.48 / QM 6759 / NRRL 1006) TaxID=441959 RepID=B8MCZ4_TALSN|nr:uncharacterized protein TSTA_113460 [Talaromyces stipitatus ATCC 10500]EED17520.1 conserved hypothetical protein [Talaromyces stipitatus ATCC 10500]